MAVGRINPEAWQNAGRVSGVRYVCGFCDSETAPALAYANVEIGHPRQSILICPNCGHPTSFVHGDQVPGVAFGRPISNAPTEVTVVYNEARRCMSVNAFTSAALACRKLLMNIAVENGAAEGLSFVAYIEHLQLTGHIPPKGRPWVDKIRAKGNEATHEIKLIEEADAREILTFTWALLHFIYELPSQLTP